MIVIYFDAGKVVQRIKVAGIKRNCGFKLVLRFIQMALLCQKDAIIVTRSRIAWI